MNTEFWESSEKVKKIYKALNESRKGQFGVYRKCIFHLHTPASYDYKFSNKYADEHVFAKLSEKDIFDIVIQKQIVPEKVIECKDIRYDTLIYKDLKEYLVYFLIAERLVELEVEMVVVTDHNTIKGYKKLSQAVQEYWKFKRGKKYPEILCGIELSCADKNHIVGIFEYSENLKRKIEEWIDEYVISEKDGTYLPSVEVLKQIYKWNGIGYIAHIDTSDIFKESYLSGTYKKVLFSLANLEVIGISNIDKINEIKNRITAYAKREFNFVVDEDSHCLEDIGKKIFWIKGVSNDFKTIKKAIRDYNISVELTEPLEPDGYIKGLYVIGSHKGFLSGREDKDFVITFSNSLNCFIGGRGTGKSTVLQILDFILGQNYVSDNKLDLICNNKEIWILYSKSGFDYLISFIISTDEDEKDNENAVEDIKRKLSADFRELQKIHSYKGKAKVQKKYFQIFRMRERRNVLEQKEIVGVSEMLSSFFDTKYSVNELVQYAETEKISDYVREVISKNNKIPQIRTVSYVKSLKGLKEKTQLVKQILDDRKRDILPVINEYNELHTKDLRITHEYKTVVDNVIDFEGIFNFRWSEKDRWFCGFNITNENCISYLEKIYDEIGTIEFYNIISSGKLIELNKIEVIEKYTHEKTFRMVEDEVTIIADTNKQDFFDKLGEYLYSPMGIDRFSAGLKKYLSCCEYYNLYFNINNKEDVNNAKPIFKSIDKLSMGQKVVAMLSFVLSYSDYSHDYRPLIIDQPEDNLDNQYIYKNLVKQLREIKSKRQIIIATHNATIVTNAKAEQVIVMESDNLHGWVRATGYPNEKRIIKHIVNNLEGGKESFQHKCFIYTELIQD